MEEKNDLIPFVGGLALAVVIPIGYLVVKGNSGFRTAEALFYFGMGLVIFFSWLSNRRDSRNIGMIPALLATTGIVLMGVWHVVPIGQFGWLEIAAPVIFFTGMMLGIISQRRMAR